MGYLQSLGFEAGGIHGRMSLDFQRQKSEEALTEDVERIRDEAAARETCRETHTLERKHGLATEVAS